MSGFYTLLGALASFQHPLWMAVAVAFLGAVAVGIALASLTNFLEALVAAEDNAPSKLVVSDSAETRALARSIDRGRASGLAASDGRGLSHHSLNAPLS
jgi:hypothetical protein